MGIETRAGGPGSTSANYCAMLPPLIIKLYYCYTITWDLRVDLSDEAEGSEDLSDVQGEGGRFVIAARAIGRGFVASC